MKHSRCMRPSKLQTITVGRLKPHAPLHEHRHVATDARLLLVIE